MIQSHLEPLHHRLTEAQQRRRQERIARRRDDRPVREVRRTSESDISRGWFTAAFIRFAGRLSDIRHKLTSAERRAIAFERRRELRRQEALITGRVA